MKRILLFLFCLGAFFATNAQYPATGLKQKLTNGVALGSKDSTAFTANDSLVLTIDRNGKLMWRGRGTNAPFKVVSDVATAGTVTNVMANNPISVTNATTTPIISLDTTFSSSGVTTRGRTKQELDSLGVISFKYTDTTGLLSQVVRTFGAQNVAGVKTFIDSTKTPSLIITATADSSILFRYPAELRTLYRENSLYPNNFGFNIVNSQSNSFFTFTEEGLAHQAYYKGDGDGNTNIWGVSSKLNTDTGWIPRIVVNQNGFVGIGTNAPLNELTVNGNLSVIGANNSITTRGSLGLVTGSFQSDNTGTFFGTNTNHPLFFRINGAEVARISTDGNWLIKSSINNGIDALQITGTSLTRGRAEILAPSLGEYFRAGGGTSSDRSLRFTSYTVSGVAGAGHQINAPNANANLALAVGGVDRLTIFETGVAGFSNRVQATQFRLTALNTAPSSATDTGLIGEIRIDANFIYICTATNTWKRVAISTW